MHAQHLVSTLDPALGQSVPDLGASSCPAEMLAHLCDMDTTSPRQTTTRDLRSSLADLARLPPRVRDPFEVSGVLTYTIILPPALTRLKVALETHGRSSSALTFEWLKSSMMTVVTSRTR